MTEVRNSRVPQKILVLILIYLFSFSAQPEGPNVQAATINVPADLPTIQEGINAASNGDTVLVSPGTYVENINFNGKNIVVGSLMLTTGDTSYIRQTIIDGSGADNPHDGSVVYFMSGEDPTAVLNGFTITGGSGIDWQTEDPVPSHIQSHGGGVFLDNNSCPSLINLIVAGNVANAAAGAGICCLNGSDCRIENVIVTGNDGLPVNSEGSVTNNGTGGISLNNSSPTLRNVLIAGNTGLLAGGMFCNEDSNPTLINVTIADNTAYRSINNDETAEFISWQNSHPVLTNTVIWNDWLPEIIVRDNAITISYSDIQGGLNGMITRWDAIVNWLDGNIDSEPMFVDPVNMDYRLQAGSPCIDTGDNSVVPRSRYGATDLDGNPRILNGIVDMGAYESSQESDMPEAGLVAYYPINEETGTIIRDASGNNHDGIAQARPTWVDGPIGYGRALYFDGSDPARAWVNCGTWNPSARTGQLTVALWVRWDGPAAGVWQIAIAKRNYWNEHGTEDMWLIGTDRESHDIYFYRQGDWPSCGNTFLPIGQWLHVAATFDGTTMIFYIDGQETGRDQFSFGPKTDSSLNIGAAELGGWGGFHGALDEIRLYNIALDAAEIKSLSSHYGAFNPEPADGSTHTDSWVTLSWSPGISAISHDVYCGDDRDSVETGTGGTFKGNQTETWFNVGSVRSPYLVPGTTYYWRIDEISTDGTRYEGDIWSFTSASGPPAEGNVIELTEATFDQVVLGSDIPVLVDFWAPWCGPCLTMAPVIEEIAKEYAGRAKVCKLDTDTSPNINKRYNIRAIPTFILFKDGQIRKRWVGVTPKEDLTAAIDAVL